MPEDPLNEFVSDRPEASNPAETTPSAEDFPSLPPDEVSALRPDSEDPEPDELAPEQPAPSPEPTPPDPRHPSPGRRSSGRSLSPQETEQRREASRQSTGPRSARGKARSRMNAVKQGVSGHARFLWDSMIAMGENPEEFQGLFANLVQSLQPVGGAEMLLVEDIAILSWKKARLDRAQQGVWERQMELLEMERRRRAFEADLQSVDSSLEEVSESGLRGLKDSPGKFEEMLSILDLLAARAQRDDFSEDLSAAITMLYGQHPGLRGQLIGGLFEDLVRAARQGQPSGDHEVFSAELRKALNEEIRDLTEQYQTYLQDKVEVSRARRQAAMAPDGRSWATMIRMENSLHRHIERKMKLLMQLQKTRRRLEHEARIRAAEAEKMAAKYPAAAGGDPA